jgi:predicted MFS family arabinose efflux permease
MSETESWRRIAIGAGAGMFLGMALGRFSYSAMIPALIEAGQLDAVSAGYVGGANLVGFLAGAATSTVAARLFRIDRLLCAVIVVAAISLALSALPWGPVWLGAWRAMIGVATGCIMVLGLSVVAQTAPARHRARAMSYMFIGVGGGILFGATVVPAGLKYSIKTAWIVVALAGALAGCIAIWCWRDLHRFTSQEHSAEQASPPRAWAAWIAVVAASFLFSIGLVPHTIYWVDYLARDLGLGYTVASLHWIGVGVFAIFGPIAAAWLANSTNTALAVVIAYFVLAVGIGMPWFSHVTAALVLSTIIFGAQPSVSALLGARARDLGDANEMPGMMRMIILTNGVGSAFAGIAIPKLLDITGSYELLFLIGGLSMLLGGLLCIPAILPGKAKST